jgi:rhodanese-related sulfurtransferase
MTMRTIGPRELAALGGGGKTIDLIDVRTPLEFREIHATGARNVPLDQLSREAVLQGRSEPATEPLYLICRSGARGQQACQKLLQLGFADVVNVEGGTVAWEKCGLPVVRGPKSISLQRQVQMIAGSLIILGSLLGWFVHPYWIVLPAAVGAGLLFTGLTDNCLMGLLLAKMPWNRVKP